MKIIITGTRGIPNEYGGFEKFAQELGRGLSMMGHEAIVFNPSNHSYPGDSWEGVRIVRQKLYFSFFSPLSSLVYDFHCLRKAFSMGPDLVLSCGYSSSLFLPLLTISTKIPVITHMDGMEWQRSKWGPFAKAFLKWNESLAMRYSHAKVVDHPRVGDYYYKNYGEDVYCIPYGAGSCIPGDLSGLSPREEYGLVISRLEPENNVEMIIRAFLKADVSYPLLVVGDTGTSYAKELLRLYSGQEKIVFLGSVYREDDLASLKSGCTAYFHGHSVGGTNPSLLEAMACSCLIFAHDNMYNRQVLGEDAVFFSDASTLADRLWKTDTLPRERMAEANLERVNTIYNWEKITSRYLELFESMIPAPGTGKK